MGKRRKARELALQTLYELEAEGKNAQVVLREHAARRGNSGETFEYANRLVEWTQADRDGLDKAIGKRLKNWDLSRLSLLMRISLRLGLAESRNAPDVPTRVIIDEAIEMARKFDSDEAASFVNGLLDALILGERGESKP